MCVHRCCGNCTRLDYERKKLAWPALNGWASIGAQSGKKFADLSIKCFCASTTLRPKRTHATTESPSCRIRTPNPFWATETSRTRPTVGSACVLLVPLATQKVRLIESHSCTLKVGTCKRRAYMRKDWSNIQIRSSFTDLNQLQCQTKPLFRNTRWRDWIEVRIFKNPL